MAYDMTTIKKASVPKREFKWECTLCRKRVDEHCVISGAC